MNDKDRILELERELRYMREQQDADLQIIRELSVALNELRVTLNEVRESITQIARKVRNSN